MRRATEGVVVAVIGLVLAACGGDDVTEVADEPDEAAGALVEPEPEPAAEELAAEPEPEDDGSGLASHRPPSDAEALADCRSIVTEEPGASIVFPGGGEAAWLDAGEGPVTVEFLGCSNTFEASLAYEAYHGENRKPTLDGVASGGSLGDWAAFSFEETFWTPGDWTVVVFEQDASSGERHEYDTVTFAVG